MPFDRDFALLLLEFVCAAGRSAKLRRHFAARLILLRSLTADRVGDPTLAAALGAAASGASIEALIYGERDAAPTFDLLITALLKA